jgi:hypothetical protein
VIADVSIAMETLEAAVSCPCAFTVYVGTEDEEPYEPAVTAVFAMLNVPEVVIGLVVLLERPVPAPMLITVPVPATEAQYGFEPTPPVARS